MQPLGILLITASVWLVYSGVTGIPPLETLQKIIANPAKASEIVSTAKAESSSIGVSDIKAAVVARNPFAKYKVNNDFQAHKDWGSGAPGVDFDAPVGTPIPTPVSGTLRNSVGAGGWGYLAEVTDAAGYVHQFGHLSRFRSDLDGQRVSAGTIIGYSGGKKGAEGAGNSTGAHIHYSIRTPSNNYIDPLAYLNRRTSGAFKAE